MILEGNTRGYGAELAQHLLNPRDNDHVTVHAVEGFVADDLAGAFAEAEAISQATQCQKYLFSLSLNPPPDASVSIEAFEAAITDVERKLGLTGQPRAVVFHEKNGRRHAHCVWSRISADAMKAINLPHYKHKLGDVTRELFRRHEWDIPEGFQDKADRDPLNYGRQEAGQAKRLNRDPKTLKALFRQCWEASDSREGFASALKEQGFILARGERRGFVAVDADGKIWSLSRWCGVKPKDLRARLGQEEKLPTIEAALGHLADLPPCQKTTPEPKLELRRTELVTRQRAERAALLKAQEERRIDGLKASQARMPKRLSAAFLKLTGRYQALVEQAEAEARIAVDCDRAEQQALIDKHLAERRALVRELRRTGLTEGFRSVVESDPRQNLVLPDDGLDLSREQLLRDPTRILAHISKTKARFDRADILRTLAKRIDDPFALKDAADRALQSPELVRLTDDGGPAFTTRDYQSAEERLDSIAHKLARTGGQDVAASHVTASVRVQDAQMNRAFGGRLSDEQRAALDHVLSGKQLVYVVGLAGAGKSTMLATAMDAWRRQGIEVHGAALAGKAADGLESASGITSRTLASLELSWENSYEPITKGDVLVVDEAGMIGTRQLARVASKIEQIGAKLVLIGDPDQLQPIEAGTPFRALMDRHPAAHLTEIHRQREDWQKQASRDLAAGRITEAVNTYADQGAITQGEDALEALVERYAMDVAADATSSDTPSTRLALAHKRKDVHALNQAIRAVVRSDNTKQPDTLLPTDTGTRAFGAQDRIVFTRNDRDIGVKNGMLGAVTRADPSEIVVQLDGEPSQTIRFDPRRFQSFDHGYAVTIHKSQGATVDQAYVLASRSMDRHLAYVAMTRHRDTMRLFIRPKDRPNWEPERQKRITFGHDVHKRSGPSLG